MDELQQLLIAANAARRDGVSIEDIDASLQQRIGMGYRQLVSTLQQQMRDRQRGLSAGETAVGVATSAGHSAAFNFLDELLAPAVAAVVPERFRAGRGLGELTEQARQSLEEPRQTFREQRPGLALASEIAGGLAGPGLGAATAIRAAGRGLLPRVGAGALVGGGAGALAGTGAADPGERLEGARRGATAGGVIGAALPAVGTAVRGTGQLAEAVGRRLTPASFGRFAANRSLRDAAERAGLTAEEFMERFRSMQEQRPDLVVPADASAQLQREVRTRINDATGDIEDVINFVRGRGQGRPERVGQDIRELTGFAEEAAVAQQRAQGRLDDLGDKLFKDIRDRWPVGQEDPRLQDILDNPDVRAVWRRVRPRTGKGEPELQHYMDLRQRLQDEVNSLRQQGRGNAARQLAQHRARLTDVLESNVPAFRAANLQYAQNARTVEAFDLGARAYRSRKSADAIAREVRELSERAGDEAESSREAYRHGMVDEALQVTVGRRQGTDPGRLVSANPEGSEIHAQIRALFPSEEAFQQFVERQLVEDRFTALRNIALGNSTTAAQANDLIRSSLHTGVFWGLRTGVLRFLAQDNPRLVRDAANELSRLLLTPGQKTADEVAEILDGALRPWVDPGVVLSTGVGAIPAIEERR